MTGQAERDTVHVESIDQAESEANISSGQYFLGGGSLILGLLPIVFHKTEDIPYDLFACTIGLIGLLVCIWMEHAKVRRLVDTLNMRTATSEQKVLQHFANHCTTLLDKFGERTEDILELLDLNKQLLGSDDKYLRTLRVLLAPTDRGMQRVKNNLIVSLAAGQLQYFHLNLDKPHSENYRLLQLGDAIQYADQYAYACTYCDPAYLMHFWNDPGDNRLGEYYRAHANAARKRSDRVQRVFVMTKEAKGDPKAYSLYRKVVDKLHATGMSCIFEIDEDRAKAVLGNRSSFFVADDEFVSESFVTGQLGLTAGPRQVAGWIAFDPKKAGELRLVFELLRDEADKI